MKRARIAYDGAIHEATAVPGDDTRLQLADGSVLHENEVIWLPPVEPRTIFALGLNYADHAKELAFKAPEEPLAFLKGPNTLIGHRAHTVRPAGVAFMHYECELVVVIGKTARNVPAGAGRAALVSTSNVSVALTRKCRKQCGWMRMMVSWPACRHGLCMWLPLCLVGWRSRS